MNIDQTGLSDNSIASPHVLFNIMNSCSQQHGTKSVSSKKKITSSKKTKLEEISQQEKKYIQSSKKKKKDVTSLRRLIRQQKIENIKRKFIAKLKLNNINSKPIEFQPYYQTQIDSFFDQNGIEIHDWIEKIISAIIVITILVCVFIDSTYVAFQQIKQNPAIRTFQVFSFCVFVFQFFSSMIFVKMVEGKKIYKIQHIFKNYLKDGMILDFAYLIVLVIDLIGNAGIFRLIILLKLPQCFQRIQKIENSIINTFYKEQYWGLAKVFFSNFSFAHIICVLLLLMSNLNTQKNWKTELGIQDASWSQQYIWSYYWSTTIMLTVGFGDIRPANYKEAICIVLIETFSCLALAYNINCVGNLISNIKSQDIEKNKNIKTFKMLSSRNDLSEDLEMKIHNYIQESTNIRKKFNFQQESNFITTLPRQLKGEFLKQSNKKIFENLLFFKNLTEKTLLNFAQVIQMKICHPEQIIRKRNQVGGIIILKEGKIGLSTKLTGSDFNYVTIQTVSIKEGQRPFLLSLDFLSNDRAIYEIKSQEYSILYYLDRQKTLQVLKTGQLDYEHFCFLKDKSRNFQTDFQVFQCEECKFNHTKFQCPKLHYCPLKKHVIDKELHEIKISKSQRKPFIRTKTVYHPFQQLSNNLKLFEIKQVTLNKFASYRSNRIRKNTNKTVDFGSRTLSPINPVHNDSILSNQLQANSNDGLQNQNAPLQSEKKTQAQWMAGYLKDELQKIISHENNVWLIESDEVKNFKFYFVSYNSSTLQYLNRKDPTQSIILG